MMKGITRRTVTAVTSMSLGIALAAWYAALISGKMDGFIWCDGIFLETTQHQILFNGHLLDPFIVGIICALLISGLALLTDEKRNRNEHT